MHTHTHNVYYYSRRRRMKCHTGSTSYHYYYNIRTTFMYLQRIYARNIHILYYICITYILFMYNFFFIFYRRRGGEKVGIHICGLPSRLRGFALQFYSGVRVRLCVVCVCCGLDHTPLRPRSPHAAFKLSFLLYAISRGHTRTLFFPIPVQVYTTTVLPVHTPYAYKFAHIINIHIYM